MTKRRRVLVLAYFFPPIGGAGVQRTLKFVEHLARLGWDATVVSTRSRVYGVQDASLLDDVPPDTRVVRTAAFPLARYAGIVLHHLRLRSAPRLGDLAGRRYRLGAFRVCRGSSTRAARAA